METLAEFVARFCQDVNCFFHPNRSGIFSLKKHNTDIRPMGVFGWVKELRRDNKFEIQSYKEIG